MNKAQEKHLREKSFVGQDNTFATKHLWPVFSPNAIRNKITLSLEEYLTGYLEYASPTYDQKQVPVIHICRVRTHYPFFYHNSNHVNLSLFTSLRALIKAI